MVATTRIRPRRRRRVFAVARNPFRRELSRRIGLAIEAARRRDDTHRERIDTLGARRHRRDQAAGDAYAAVLRERRALAAVAFPDSEPRLPRLRRRRRRRRRLRRRAFPVSPTTQAKIPQR